VAHRSGRRGREEKIILNRNRKQSKERDYFKRNEDFKSFTTDKLRDLLKDAIDKEDYERAAKIRDELGKRN